MYEWRKFMDDEDYIRNRQEWITRRKAMIDQREKQFEDQYPMMRPMANSWRLEDIEALKFEVEFDEWELGEIIKSLEEESDETQDG